MCRLVNRVLNLRLKTRANPFYDDRYKLLLYFPTEIESPLIYKDALSMCVKVVWKIHSSIVGTALNIMSLYIGSIRLPEIIRVGWLWFSLTIQPAMCMGGFSFGIECAVICRQRALGNGL